MCFNNAYSLLNISLFNICVVISQEIEFVCQLCELSCRPFISSGSGISMTHVVEALITA